MAAWVDIVNAPGIFTTSSAATWTVSSGDQVTYAYQVSDIGSNTVTVVVWLESTSVSAGTATDLRIELVHIPRTGAVAACWYSDNGTRGIGTIEVQAGVSYARVRKQDPTSSWAAATNTTWVVGQLTYEK